jgi:hypothetical protein
MRGRVLLVVVGMLSAAGALGALEACGRDRASQGAGGPDAGSGLDGGTEALPAEAAPPCSTNPQTYLEIINACTDAEAIDKSVDLSPMSLPDGGLRPLP